VKSLEELIAEAEKIDRDARARPESIDEPVREDASTEAATEEQEEAQEQTESLDELSPIPVGESTELANDDPIRPDDAPDIEQGEAVLPEVATSLADGDVLEAVSTPEIESDSVETPATVELAEQSDETIQSQDAIEERQLPEVTAAEFADAQADEVDDVAIDADEVESPQAESESAVEQPEVGESPIQDAEQPDVATEDVTEPDRPEVESNGIELPESADQGVTEAAETSESPEADTPAEEYADQQQPEVSTAEEQPEPSTAIVGEQDSEDSDEPASKSVVVDTPEPETPAESGSHLPDEQQPEVSVFEMDDAPFPDVSPTPVSESPKPEKIGFQGLTDHPPMTVEQADRMDFADSQKSQEELAERQFEFQRKSNEDLAAQLAQELDPVFEGIRDFQAQVTHDYFQQQQLVMTLLRPT